MSLEPTEPTEPTGGQDAHHSDPDPDHGPDTDTLQQAFDLAGISAPSLTRFARVHRGRTHDGADVVVKRAARNSADAVATWTRGLAAGGIGVVTPLAVGGDNPRPFPAGAADEAPESWVVYPFVQGDAYHGTPSQIRSAGELLGAVHAAEVATGGMRKYHYPDADPDVVADDLTRLWAVFREHAPEQEVEPLVDAVTRRSGQWLSEALPALRAADAAGELPRVAATDDFKANNLVFVGDEPIVIDPDNAAVMPRILDLALAVVLFHNESETSPARMLTTLEWELFLTGYRSKVDLTDHERRLWPAALLHQWWEEGTWVLEDNDEQAWADERQHDFLLALAAMDVSIFPL